VHSVINSIQQNPGAEHSLEELAAHAGLTPSHFCRVFKKATGASPHQYVMRVRLERAKQLLIQTDLGLGELADSLGFASQSHFTRLFRQAVGRTPSAFRHNKGAMTLQ
jgi:AraC family transcriptional regulator